MYLNLSGAIDPWWKETSIFQWHRNLLKDFFNLFSKHFELLGSIPYVFRFLKKIELTEDDLLTARDFHSYAFTEVNSRN